MGKLAALGKILRNIPIEENSCNSTGNVLDCLIFPILVNSRGGLWDYVTGAPNIFTASLQTLEFQIIVVLATTHVVHLLFVRNIGPVPLFISQLIAGVLLGSSVFGQLNYHDSVMFPNKSLEMYDLVAGFGFLIFTFLVGVKTNPAYALRYGRRAIVVGISITIIPTMVAIYLLQSSPTSDKDLLETRQLVVGPQLITSLAVISQLVIDLRISNTEMGRLAIASAVAAHSLDLFLVHLINALMSHQLESALATALFVASCFLVLRPLMQWMIRQTPEGQPVEEWVTFTTILLSFMCSWFTSIFDQFPTVGAFIFGLVVPEGPPLGSALQEKLEDIINGIFLPLYAASITMRFSPWSLFSDLSEAKFAIGIVLSTFVVKVVVCFITSLLLKMHWKEALTFSLIMSSKGIVEASYYVYYADKQEISKGAYSTVVFGLLLNSSILPIVIQSLYNSMFRRYSGYEKGRILNLNHNSELKILACVHDPDEVAPLISFLNATGYSQECPVNVCLLHLVELIGSSTPLFITHQGYEKQLVGHSYEDVILAFNQLEQKSRGSVMVNSFTAISPPNTMHIDICTLAYDHQTTLIILPFHRKWSDGGFVESENAVLRNMNRSVLDNALCSAAILVHRPTSKQTIANLLSAVSFNLCMIFFGGNDDHEALALVRRMANDPKVCLTVVYFTAKVQDITEYMNWATILDFEELKQVKKDRGDKNVFYKEENVKDGPETAKKIRMLVNSFDLIVVGRRYGLECPQTSNLSEWTEFPELGIIGDFLASTDIKCGASILIVQQQKYYDDDPQHDDDHVGVHKLTSTVNR